MGGFPNVELFAVLADVAEQRIGDFRAQSTRSFSEPFLYAAFWPFSRRAGWTNALSLFENAKRSGLFSLCSGCFRGLLLEFEQRGLEQRVDEYHIRRYHQPGTHCINTV